MDIGKAIYCLRKQKGLKQYEFAKICDISPTSLSLIENCERNPSARTVKKISDYFEIPVPLIHLLALEESDVPESKKEIYKIIYPSIKMFALQLLESEQQVTEAVEQLMEL
jgi:transcriptional regulator with XRE-family HTH domain